MSEFAIYLIESGPALELAQAHWRQVEEYREQVEQFRREAGAYAAKINQRTGTVEGALFSGSTLPPDSWTKPDKHGMSRPNSRTAEGKVWREKILAMTPFPDAESTIGRELGIPMEVQFERADGTSARAIIGLRPVGFLVISDPECTHGLADESTDTPTYGMWVPDMQRIVQDYEQRGEKVVGPVWDMAQHMQIEGCSRISSEEWRDRVVVHDQQVEQRRQDRQQQEQQMERQHHV